MMRAMTPRPPVPPMNSQRTAWHITVGTYCSRLHGGERPTVDRAQNKRGQPFIGRDEARERSEREAARGPAVSLTPAQRELIEGILPAICERGGWTYRIAAVPGPPENDHFHILLEADPAIHGKQIRKWLKRWLTEELDKTFGRPEGGEWWVEDGSTKPVKDATYFGNVFYYIFGQRTTAYEVTA
jgi:REP element-mobilizing transposase RayT